MAVGEILYTAESLWDLSSAGGKRYELIRGALSEMSPTGGIHGEIALWLGSLILTYVKTHKLGRVFGAETGFTLGTNPDTVLAPDVAFVSKDRLPASTEKYPAVPPDLAVEIVSPGNSQTELHEKVVAYFHAGTGLNWIVYPRSRAVYVYRSSTEVSILGINDVLEGDTILPGFQVEIREIFEILDG